MKNMPTKVTVKTRYIRPIQWIGLFLKNVIDIYPKQCYHKDKEHMPKTYDKGEMILCQEEMVWDLWV